MSSRGVLASPVGVGEEGAVDGFGELSFEESEGFVAAVGELPPESWRAGLGCVSRVIVCCTGWGLSLDPGR